MAANGADPPPVVVHLVHGTWPFGPFRRSGRGRKAWFEEGSSVRASIDRHAGCPIEFREFRWSGRNSMRARAEAARQLILHLDDALTERADTKHVIVAHSHGGTVAAKALASVDIPGTPRVRALLCLATPFTYLTSSARSDRDVIPNAMAGVVVALGFIAGMLWSDFPTNLNAWLLALATPAVLTVATGVLYGLSSTPSPSYFGGRTIHAAIPVFLLRATRDEAALLIGMAQSLHFLAAKYYEKEDNPPKPWEIRRSVKYIGTLWPIWISMVLLVVAIGGDALPSSLIHRLVAIYVFVNGLNGLVLLAGYGAVALAVGFWNVRQWPATIVEVDAAPQGKECAFKSYSDIDSIASTTARHGLYEHPDVQEEIGLVIRAVSSGSAPRLITAEEFDAKADRERGATTLVEVFGKADLAWGDLPDGVRPVIREEMFEGDKPFVIELPPDSAQTKQDDI